jgi:hypothetical protein
MISTHSVLSGPRRPRICQAANDWYALPTPAYRARIAATARRANGFVDGTTPLTAGAYLLVGWDVAGTTLRHYLNGEPNGEGQITATLADAGTPLLIGTRGDLFTKMKGDIAELIIYNTALSDADRSKVVNYLGSKYGIPVSAGPPQLAVSRSGNNVTISWPPEVTGFHASIGGHTAEHRMASRGWRREQQCHRAHRSWKYILPADAT